MLKKILNFLLAGNVSKEHYEIAQDDMYKNNVLMLRVLSSIATSILIVCVIVGLFVPNMMSKLPTYLIGLVFSGAVLIASVFSHSRKLHSVCMYVFDILLLSIGLLITLVSAPEQLTVTLIPVSLLIPLFFDTKPFKFLIVVLASDLVYMICAPIVKPAEILALDLVDVLAFSFAGILIGTVITRVKIERYVYAREIRRAAIYDGLTACLNRAAYNEFLEENKKVSDNFTAVMIDINGLKGVNDNLGHKAGDEMIITVASAMKFVFDKFGKCYRLGGDEFIAFVEVEEKKLEELVDSFRKVLAQNDGEFVKSITVSIGCSNATISKSNKITDIISEADKKMYEDKAEYYARTGLKRRT